MDRVQFRRDTAANWQTYNPVLMEGEMGLVTDKPNQYKIGDGTNTWNDLPLRGYNGNIAQELGDDEDAVMSQNSVTKYLINGFRNTSSINFIDSRYELSGDDIKEYSWIDSTVLNSDGTTSTNIEYKTTDYIGNSSEWILGGTYIQLGAIVGTNINSLNIAYYDNNKNFLYGCIIKVYDTKLILIPPRCYIRVCALATEAAKFNVKASINIDYTQESKLASEYLPKLPNLLDVAYEKFIYVEQSDSGDLDITGESNLEKSSIITLKLDKYSAYSADIYLYTSTGNTYTKIGTIAQGEEVSYRLDRSYTCLRVSRGDAIGIISATLTIERGDILNRYLDLKYEISSLNADYTLNVGSSTYTFKTDCDGTLSKGNTVNLSLDTLEGTGENVNVYIKYVDDSNTTYKGGYTVETPLSFTLDNNCEYIQLSPNTGVTNWSGKIEVKYPSNTNYDNSVLYTSVLYNTADNDSTYVKDFYCNKNLKKGNRIIITVDEYDGENPVDIYLSTTLADTKDAYYYLGSINVNEKINIVLHTDFAKVRLYGSTNTTTMTGSVLVESGNLIEPSLELEHNLSAKYTDYEYDFKIGTIKYLGACQNSLVKGNTVSISLSSLSGTGENVNIYLVNKDGSTEYKGETTVEIPKSYILEKDYLSILLIPNTEVTGAVGILRIQSSNVSTSVESTNSDVNIILSADNLSSDLTTEVPDLHNNYKLSMTCNVSEMGKINISKGAGQNICGRIDIDSTSVYIYNHLGSVTSTVTHNLTIKDFLSVNIILDRKVETAKLVIITNGGIYTNDAIAWLGSYNNILLHAESGNYSNVSFIMSIKKTDFWIYGDSYCDLWPEKMQENYVNGNYTIDGYSGRNSINAYNSLQRLTALGYTPKTIIWLLGMNDADSSTEINNNYMSTINNLCVFCQANNVNLYVGTIPNTPKITNKYKNDYIKTLKGIKVIDISALLGADEIGSYWHTGLLSSDEVHPSDEGAVVYAGIIQTYIPY